MLGRIWGSKRKLVFSNDRRRSWSSWSGLGRIGLEKNVKMTFLTRKRFSV
jgi:hypothetical protein